MFKLEPKVFNLNEEDHLWLRPWEDFEGTMDFDKDVSGWDFKILFKEYQWPHMPGSYSVIEPGEMDDIFTFETNWKDEPGALVRCRIDNDVIKAWTGRRIDLRMQVNNGSRTWICFDKTLAVTEGD